MDSRYLIDKHFLQQHTYRFLLYLLLLVSCAIMLLPFFWMVTTSFKEESEVLRMPPQWFPKDWLWRNYIKAWNVAPFGRYFFNSFFMAITTTIGEVITTILAAYAFAKMRFFGKNVLFAILLGTLMIPGQMLLIPNYVTITRLGWFDRYEALIIPWLASVFGIFLLRQFFRSIPNELQDAARIDGCSRLRFLWQIVVPLSKPAIMTVALLKSLGSWNAFLWVLIMTNSDKLRPIQVGLSYFAQEQGTEYGLMMAAATFCVAPIVVVYFIAQRNIIESYAKSGIKG